MIPHWEAMTCAEIDENVIILLKYLQATHPIESMECGVFVKSLATN